MPHRYKYLHLYILTADNTPDIVTHVLNRYGTYGYKAIHIQTAISGGVEIYLCHGEEVQYAVHYSAEPLPSLEDIIATYREDRAKEEHTEYAVHHLTGEWVPLIQQEEGTSLGAEGEDLGEELDVAHSTE